MGDGRHLPYPMWVVYCGDCGGVCTIWEKPGTGCSYINHCPDCGKKTVETIEVNSAQEQKTAMSEGEL